MNIRSKINKPNIMNSLKSSVDSSVINNTIIAELNRINTIKVDSNNTNNNINIRNFLIIKVIIIIIQV